MGLSSIDIVNVLESIAEKINGEKDYITELDAILGDGDHWVNMNKGYQALIGKFEEMRQMSPAEVFKTIGMTLMSSIGGSSGVLYGSAFIQAHKVLTGNVDIDLQTGYSVMEACLEAIMNRGKAKPGDKTMIDPLSDAVKAYRLALDKNLDAQACMSSVVAAAQVGMESTKDMVAMKGRATYQTNKGVGHIDAGAVTMFYTIEGFGSYVMESR